MSHYDPSFNRDAKGKFNPNSGFVSVKGGTDAYLLEDELNELQWLQTEARAELIRQMTGSGYLQINDFTNPDLPGGLKELGTTALNTFALNGFDVILNGYISHIAASQYTVNKIKLPAPPNNGFRFDFVFIEFWFQEMKQYEKIPEFGGIANDPITYDIIDPRLNFETSRRVQLQWAIRSVSNVNPTTYPLGFVDSGEIPNPAILAKATMVAPVNSMIFRVSENDKFLFVAGHGTDNDKLQTKTLDGFVYAMPLMFVRRLNNGGYHPKYNPEGAVDYVDANTVSGRVDGKFSNVIYRDQIRDLRRFSKISEEQFNTIYVRKEEFEDYKYYIDTTLTEPLQKVQTSMTTLDDYVRNTLEPKFTNEDARLDARITGYENDLNTNVVRIDAEITDLRTSLTKSFQDADKILNDKIDNLATKHTTDIATVNQTITTQIDGIKASITDLKNQHLSDVNAINSRINVEVNDLNEEIDTLRNQHSVDTSNIEAEITNVNTTLNTRIDNLQLQISDIVNSQITTQITIIRNDLDALKADLQNKYDFLYQWLTNIQQTQVTLIERTSNALSLISHLDSRITTIEYYLKKLGMDTDKPSDLLIYGIEMVRDNQLTSGGTIQTNNTILSTGTSITIPNDYPPYCTITTINASPEGKVGDLWVEKATNVCLVKNTGNGGIPFNIAVIKLNNTFTFAGQSAFNGLTGARVTHVVNPTDFLYIAPLNDLEGEIGEFFVDLDSTGFTVYNTGATGNQFEWVVIDTTQLRNTALVELTLNGIAGVSSADPTYKTNFSVSLGVPTRPMTNDMGSIGDLSVLKSFNSFTVYCTGGADKNNDTVPDNMTTVKCLVFKEAPEVFTNPTQ
jgi:hypothetical protein